MKNILVFTIVVFSIYSCKKESFTNGTLTPGSNTESTAMKIWRDNKMAMMVHFGLYSHFGGIYNGQNITKGYSEQIMAHAPIPAAEYRAAASSFNPTNWNSDSIVDLAKRGGFKSVVITAKHHDGFCLFDSQYSDFTITQSTPYKKDIIKDLAAACQRGGIRFGVYFSLIDWNAKEGATIISDHNADPIAPALHQNNLNQIKELLSNYGDISEIWFDMGSLTQEQSKEIRKQVKDIQPDCMIGGRLGNGQGDFNVLADNELPDEFKIEQPWQTVNSIFTDTWGYRAWQKNGDVDEKAKEHLSRIVNTIIKGGNYTLNIGPKGDGSIVEFEKKVIEKVGLWINSENSDVVFGTRPFPAGLKGWGGLVIKAPNIYMIVTSTPDEGRLLLYGVQNQLTDATKITAPYESLTATISGATVTFDLGIIPLTFDPATVIKIGYEGDLKLTPARQIYQSNAGKFELTALNANISYGMDGANYYTTVPSVTKYSWDIAAPKEIDYETVIFYSQQEKNKIVKLSINGHEERLDLSKYKTFSQVQNENKGIPSAVYYQGPYRGLSMTSHKGPLNWAVPGEQWGPDKKLWTEIPNSNAGKMVTFQLDSGSACYYLINILGSMPVHQIVAVGADDAFMAYFNGKLMYSTGYTQPDPNVVFLDLPIQNESNTLILKHFNTGGPFKTFFTSLIDQIRFEKPVVYSTLLPKQTNHIELSLADPAYPNENLGTPNIKIIIQEKKKSN